MLEIKAVAENGRFGDQDAQLAGNEIENTAFLRLCRVVAPYLASFRPNRRLQGVGFLVRVTPDEPRILLPRTSPATPSARTAAV